MTPQVVYTLNGVVKTIVFELNEFTKFTPDWVRDEIIYKNPFTGDMTRKNRGYYYTATITFDGISYDLTADYHDLFNAAISDIKFYPDKNGVEYFDVDSNEEINGDDNDAAQAYENFSIVFRSKQRYQTALDPGPGYWGNRTLRFMDTNGRTFGSTI